MTPKVITNLGREVEALIHDQQAKNQNTHAKQIKIDSFQETKLNSIQSEPTSIEKFEFPYQLKEEDISIDDNYKQKFT